MCQGPTQHHLRNTGQSGATSCIQAGRLEAVPKPVRTSREQHLSNVANFYNYISLSLWGRKEGGGDESGPSRSPRPHRTHASVPCPSTFLPTGLGQVALFSSLHWQQRKVAPSQRWGERAHCNKKGWALPLPPQVMSPQNPQGEPFPHRGL